MNCTEEMVCKLWRNRSGVEHIKWDEIFDSEAELIETIKTMRIVDKGSRPTSGYAYLRSFQRRLLNGTPMTPKQLTQAKRLAPSIAFEILCAKR